MHLFRHMVRKLLSFVHLDAPLLLYSYSGLSELGWSESYYARQSINRSKEPIPWNTYAFVSFLEPRLQRSFRVFEYGCGNSTLWYAARVGEVISVEHDESWAMKVQPQLPTTARICVRRIGEGYVEEITNHGAFDVVVVDGENRIECIRASLSQLKPDGVVILDNAEWVALFQEAKQVMAEHGFRCIEFRSMGPINLYLSTTVVFYRSQSCLGI